MFYVLREEFNKWVKRVRCLLCRIDTIEATLEQNNLTTSTTTTTTSSTTTTTTVP